MTESFAKDAGDTMLRQQREIERLRAENAELKKEIEDLKNEIDGLIGDFKDQE